MTILHAIPAHLILVYTAYAVGCASPGPSILAIMGMAMNAGRKPAVMLALGVISGSAFWGFSAAFGLSTLLAAYSNALVVIRTLGGLYMLWLAAKSLRSAVAKTHTLTAVQPASVADHGKTYVRGLTMHLTNPKAIFVWLSIISLGLPNGAHTRDSLVAVGGCVALGICIFMGYALAFSTPAARRVYQAARRWLELGLAGMFTFAGLHMLMSRS